MRPVAAALVLVACGGRAAEPPRPAPAPRPPARDPDLVRMPDDVWAIAAVDLTQLRGSTARRWVWQLLAEHSPVVHRCRDELAAGTRVTIGLRERDRDSSATFAIVHGIDRAAVTTCLHAPPGELPELPPSQEPCDDFDAAVHALASCGTLPMTRAPGLHELADRIATDGAAACPAAARAIEAATARRVELGWECRVERHHDRTTARIAARARDVDRDTVALGDYERVHFVDDHTIEIGAAEAVGGAEDAEATGKVLAELRPSAKARWFEASAQTIDRTRGGWLVADLQALIKEPVVVAGSVNLRGDIAVDLQVANPPAKLTNEVIGVAERAIVDPLMAGVRVELGCSPAVTPPRTPQYLACEAAQDHLQAREAPHGFDPKGLLVERALRCVADNWPADYVACIAATATEADWDRCYQQLSASDRERIEAGLGSACGSRAFHAHITVPERRIEALELQSILDLEPVRDCRSPIAGPPTRLATGKTYSDREAVRVCFSGPLPADLPPEAAPLECSLVALDERAGSPDARWLVDDGFDGGDRCIGPMTFAPQLRWSNGNCDLARAGALMAYDQRPIFEIRPDGTKGLATCRRGSPCVPTPKFDALAIASDGNLVAVRTGKTIETWDPVRGTRAGRFTIEPACTELSIAGALVALGCGAKSYLATRTGTRVATLGDVLLSPLRLLENRWGFVSRTGDRLVAYDGATGKEHHRTALPHTALPGMVAAVGDAKGRAIVAYGGSGPEAGAVVIVDPAGLQELRQTACPVTPAGH